MIETSRGTTRASLVLPRLAILPVAVISTLLALGLFSRLDVWLEDYVITTQNRSIAPDNIVLVTVSEETLANLKYRSPVDRGFLADVVAHVSKAGASAIGLDILIDQPSEPAKDALLKNALESAGIPAVVGYAGEAENLTERQIEYLNLWTDNLTRGLVTLRRDDFDGAIRQIFSGRRNGERHVPSLAAALAGELGVLPPYPAGRIAYFSKADGAPFDFPAYPAHTVQFIPSDWFENKIVLIGSALPTADLHQTPFSTTTGTRVGSLYGVTIHAHVLAQILSNQHIHSLGMVESALMVLVASVLAGLVTIWPIAPILRVAALVVMFSIAAVVCLYLFRQSQVLVSPATAIAGATLTAIILAFREWRRDRTARRFVEDTFAKYVSPAVVRRIVANHDQLKLGGETRRVTYVFTDLQGFTAMCEGMDPEQIALLLNDYLDRICTLFIDHAATIDKIIGDAVVGFFGAPEQQDDQCRRAVDLALAIDRFAEEYRAQKRAEGFAWGSTRIGIHNGEAVVGNFGGSRFVDYTSIGDTVNSAARMEAANKVFGTRICVSEAVADECATHQFRPIGEIVLRGKSQKLLCFEPLHPGTMPTAQLEAYRAAFLTLQQGESDAVEKFARLRKRFPDDPLAAYHHDRLLAGETGSTIAA